MVMLHVSRRNVGTLITSEIIRAGRMLLRWDQKALAEAAGVSHVTVRRLEAKPGPLAAERATIAKLRSALEAAGLVFIEADGEVEGLKKAQWRSVLDHKLAPSRRPSSRSKPGAATGPIGLRTI